MVYMLVFMPDSFRKIKKRLILISDLSIYQFSALLDELGSIYTFHGGLMVAGGILFGMAVIKAGVLPRWTGCLLILGVSLNLLFFLLAFPDLSHIISSIVRNIAFIGMGVAILRSRQSV